MATALQDAAMARMRTVHPGLATDEELVSCTIPARFLFVLLGTEADDYGCFEWKPLRLKMRLFPADNSVHIEPLLDELLKVEKLLRYEVDGKSYGAIRNFCQYQNPKSPSEFCARTTEVNKFINLAFRNSPKREIQSTPDMFDSTKGDIFSAEGRKKKEGRKEGTDSDLTVYTPSLISIDGFQLDEAASPSGVMLVWNSVFHDRLLPKIDKLTEGRKKVIGVRIKDGLTTLGDFKVLFDRVRESPFLTGHNDRQWIADFDWCLKPANLQKIAEDRYAPRGVPRQAADPSNINSVFDRIRRRMGGTL